MNPPAKTMAEFITRFEDQLFGMAMFGVIRGNDDPSWKNRTEHMRGAPDKVKALLEDMYRFLHAPPLSVPASPVVPPVANRMPATTNSGTPAANGVAPVRR